MAMSRFSSVGFKDLDVQFSSFTYSAVRSSCWINMIPAGGLVVVPEGSSSCQCAYNHKTSLALMPDDRTFYYGVGGMDRSDLPGLRINFGAPGDRADADGKMWYAYPRPLSPRVRFDPVGGLPIMRRMPLQLFGKLRIEQREPTAKFSVRLRRSQLAVPTSDQHPSTVSVLAW